MSTVNESKARSGVSARIVAAVGLAVALVLAGFVSYYASGSPDGLEKVAADKGFDAGAKDHAGAEWPLADYGVSGVENARLSGGLSGVIGVGVVLLAGGGLFWVLRRRPERGDGA
ncbi:PDGLE domain-containing protein [Actinocorallia sp. A-T 12471]|uniref:PDGLE domain-containing protein n=1 Tax=Actinocorallia sp. A-T 12471 TaxID=3089813 RepID=UPI0029CF1B5C|nr:PDGLE domain-containing protein [Actinocorallia sp. A-T 12471]MDX6742906.1 PDGLE domain-containing protein [Actinocorallia sp. A-T 12471]